MTNSIEVGGGLVPRDWRDSAGATGARGATKGARGNAELVRSWAFRMIVAYAWISILYTYSPAKREAPQGLGELDGLGLFKLVHRMFSLIFVAVMFYGLVRNVRIKSICARLTPLIFFALFAVCSTVWSPFPEKSLGKAMGVAMGVVLAVCAGLVCNQDRRVSDLMKHLAILCFVVTVFNFLAEFNAYGMGALQRYRFRSDLPRDGILMHAGAIGNIAGLSAFLTYANYSFFKQRWSRKLILPVLGLCGLMIFITNSRASTAATILAMGAVAVVSGGVRAFFLTMFAPMLGVVFLLGSSGEAFDEVANKVQSYALRGQSLEEVQSLSGRDEKWEMAWDGFNNAIFLGGGYDVVSGYTGLFVNGRWQPLPVHNLYLFVLTGTGLIGMTLLVIGLGFVFLPLVGRVLAGHARRGLAIVLLCGISIFLLVGYTEVIFVGGNGVSSTVAYCLIGLAAAECGRKAVRPGGNAASVEVVK